MTASAIHQQPLFRTVISISTSLKKIGTHRVLDGAGNGNPLQYSFLETPMERGAWKATVRVHGITEFGHNLVTKQQQSSRT